MIYLTKRPDLYYTFNVKVFDYYKDLESLELSIPIHLYNKDDYDKDNYDDIIVYSLLDFVNYSKFLSIGVNILIPKTQFTRYDEIFYSFIVGFAEFDINQFIFSDMSYFNQSIYFLDSINLPIFLYDNKSCLTNIKNLDNIYNIDIFNDVLSTFSSFDLFK